MPHPGHVYCGRRICVPAWLEDDLLRTAGRIDVRASLRQAYRLWDEALAASGEPAPDPFKYIRRQFVALLDAAIAAEADAEAARWAEVTAETAEAAARRAERPTEDERRRIGAALRALAERLGRRRAGRVGRR